MCNVSIIKSATLRACKNINREVSSYQVMLIVKVQRPFRVVYFSYRDHFPTQQFFFEE